jgi:hypothetical protein
MADDRHRNRSKSATSTEDDLGASVIENNGIRIETRLGMGRVTVATKPFDLLHAKVVREKPALVFKAGDFLDYLEKFAAVDDSIQDGILDMYHPPLSAPSVSSLAPVALWLKKSGPFKDVEFIHKLLAIMATNAHEYFGTMSSVTDGDLTRYEQAGVGTVNNTGKAALFIYGSKIPHSCDPNVSYSSRTIDGALEYKVIRPIAMGEVVAFTYMKDLYQTPTFERQEYLMRTKAFMCQCQRCVGQDYCRFAKCSSCSEFVACGYQEQDAIWNCPACGICSGIDQKERVLLARMNRMEPLGADSPVRELHNIVRESSETLSPVHYITVRANETLARLYASKAHHQQQFDQMMMPFSKRAATAQKSNFRLAAAVAGLQVIASSECVAAGCSGCDIGSLRHPPLYGRAETMFHACMDLKEVPVKSRPVYAAQMVSSYLALMRGTFGDDDADVKFIEENIVKQRAAPSCGNCRRVSYGHLCCARCKKVFYCDKSCQKSHWLSGHKHSCSQVQHVGAKSVK